MQTVQIHLWDDRHAGTGQRVEAEEQVELSFRRGSRVASVRLDLTHGNADELEAVVLPWLKIGSAAGSAPEFRHGFKPGSKAAREWRQALRDWADAEGRTSEYMARNPSAAKNRFTYPLRLVQDFEAHLVSLAENAV
jgi:hypothetical protein